MPLLREIRIAFSKVNMKAPGNLTEHMIALSLKVVSTTFLLVYFLCLKESTCEARKNAFYFTLKALFVLEIIKF